MHNPEKKDSTTSAIAEGAILGFSASTALSRFSGAQFFDAISSRRGLNLVLRCP
jgi:hypothetical protein